MKKYLLPKNGNFYKANLHCHTTFSDGDLTPAEVKKIYSEKGYSIVAYTDHDILLSHQYLTDDKFLALNGLELEFNEKVELTNTTKTCHICAIALDEDNLIQPCYHREKFLLGIPNLLRDKIKYDNSLPDFEREFSPENINKAIKECRDKGFFVTYNHPVWSLETYNDYINYEGMNAMEICNYSSLAAGYAEYNENKYDEMLTAGKKIYCVGADDNHNHRTGRMYDSFGAFVVIKADKLEYKTITSALLNGDFYASQGPEIYDLWIEGNRLYVKTSKCDSIRINTDLRLTNVVYDTGEGLDIASFTIPKGIKYFRITVTDKEGKHANTRAYFLEDLQLQ